jgi:hypothetical protein
MKKLRVLLLAGIGSLALSAAAQDTNLLKTDIGAFENRPGLIIIKGFNPIGSIQSGPTEIAIRCKESTEAASGAKAYGLLVAVNSNQQLHERIYVDDDEMDPLLGAVSYLSKATSDITKLPAFEAGFTTKSGLRILARSDHRNASVRFFLGYNDEPRIELSPVQMTQLYDLIAEAQKQLISLRAGR